MNVCVTKVYKPELLNVDNPQYHEPLAKYSLLEGVTMNDIDPKPKLPVHLFLGANDYLCIKTDQPARVVKTDEPVA